LISALPQTPSLPACLPACLSVCPSVCLCVCPGAHSAAHPRDGSTVKSTDCFSEGPEFKSQQPHGGSQPSVTRSGTLF
jgi:hypothetical protein